jgi:hypothetical protein
LSRQLLVENFVFLGLKQIMLCMYTSGRGEPWSERFSQASIDDLGFELLIVQWRSSWLVLPLIFLLYCVTISTSSGCTLHAPW